MTRKDMMRETNLKQMLLKMGIVFGMAATFALIFQIQTTLLHVLVMSAILSLLVTAVETMILKSKEPVITHLYALFLFVLIMIIPNWYTFLFFGRGMLNQMAVFYFAIALTIFITVYDFYKPRKN